MFAAIFFQDDAHENSRREHVSRDSRYQRNIEKIYKEIQRYTKIEIYIYIYRERERERKLF